MSKAGGARTTPVGQTFRSAQPIRSAGRPSSARLTHADAQGRVRMVDVSEKPVTRREAVARGSITMSAAARTAVRRGAVKKGDPLQAARLAGIMAAKQTSALIPLCHPLPLTSVNVELASTRRGYDIAAHVRTDAKTGVEMEALTAVAVAALTVYDMLKAIDKAMEIGEIRLVSKTGGKSGTWFGPNGRPAGKQPPGMLRSQRKRL